MAHGMAHVQFNEEDGCAGELVVGLHGWPEKVLLFFIFFFRSFFLWVGLTESALALEMMGGMSWMR